MAWLPPTGIGPADGVCERRQHQPGTGGDERRHPVDGMCGNAGEQRAGIFAGELAPQRGALLEHVASDERRGDRIAWNRTLVAEEKVDDTGVTVGERAQ